LFYVSVFVFCFFSTEGCTKNLKTPNSHYYEGSVTKWNHIIIITTRVA